ncbi:MAG: MGMT family protein [Candidatus Dojkabacteria bacterium]
MTSTISPTSPIRSYSKPGQVFERIYNVVKQIPKGSVVTYGEIAGKAGIRNPRIVGFALHNNPDPKSTPCHRVVKKDGSLAEGFAFGGKAAQRRLLESEGVKFVGEKVLHLKIITYPL